MRARWCMGRCRLVRADDRQQRKQRHRGHLEIRLFLGANRRPAHASSLTVHVARWGDGHNLPGRGVGM